MHLFLLHATGSQFLSAAEEHKRLGDFTAVNKYVKKKNKKEAEEDRVPTSLWERAGRSQLQNCHFPPPVIAHTIKTFSKKIHS